MRIAIGGIAHETNTFCTGLTTMEAFTERESGTGAEITARHQGVRSYIGGMLDAAADLGIKVVPTFYASATPSGTISRATLDSLLERLLSGIRDAMPVDAVALALHGAGVAEGADDIESVILARVRELVGDEIPIVVTLDLHGNMTQEMLAHADALFGVHLYPHTDAYERGREAVELIPRLLSGEVKPAMHLTMLPMMIPTSTTNLPPASEVNARCWEWERREGVLDCAFFHGFPTTDIPRPTVSVLAMTNNDPALAREIANDVAGFIWEIQERFRPVITPPEEAIRQALAAEGRPVVINDTADNPGGGAPGDATHLLRAMLEANLQDACFGYITDSETAAQAHAAGVGATIQVRLGGKTEPLHGEPIEATAYVKSLSDGRFIQQSPMGRGARVDLGKMARLQIGGVDVIVGTVRTQTLDPELFLLNGIDVTRYKIVALKSSNHFRAGFEPIAHKIIRADTPGLVSVDLTSFPFQRLEHPVWPHDEPVWEPE